MDNKSKAFQKLQKEWYSKLKNEGFEDIEQSDEKLKIWHSSRFNKFANSPKGLAKEEYYRIAGHFLHDHPFENETDRLIWTLHSEGLSIRNIIKVLKSKNIKAYKDIVHPRIQLLTKLMFNKQGKSDE